MQKFISQKQLYSNMKSVTDEVQNGTTFIVLKYSKPAYRIAPLEEGEEKYRLNTFEKANSTSLFEDFSDIHFSDKEDLSQNIDNILYQ